MGFSDDDGDLLEESKLLFLLYKLTLVLTTLEKTENTQRNIQTCLNLGEKKEKEKRLG